MPTEQRIVSPGSQPRTVRSADGEILSIPASWDLLAPGDAALTRRVKAAGPSWTVQEKRGRKTFSRGVWAPRATIESIRETLACERSTDAYAKRRARDARRREDKQNAYVSEFQGAVLAFLAFDAAHAEVASRMAAAITRHATPVGSGTVARTQRIPIEERAESAVIAWMRHQTTAYDNLQIPRVKGMRREVRRQLAEQSRSLLTAYRLGHAVGLESCPLQQALVE
ncbi:MAG: DUF2293 domain-containing protein [Planctomycetes bacterium]|nr:DUF2293 domain-containing protein [Planctomycetota bacterium]